MRDRVCELPVRLAESLDLLELHLVQEQLVTYERLDRSELLVQYRRDAILDLRIVCAQHLRTVVPVEACVQVTPRHEVITLAQQHVGGCTRASCKCGFSRT